MPSVCSIQTCMLLFSKTPNVNFLIRQYRDNTAELEKRKLVVFSNSSKVKWWTDWSLKVCSHSAGLGQRPWVSFKFIFKNGALPVQFQHWSQWCVVNEQVEPLKYRLKCMSKSGRFRISAQVKLWWCFYGVLLKRWTAGLEQYEDESIMCDLLFLLLTVQFCIWTMTWHEASSLAVIRTIRAAAQMGSWGLSDVSSVSLVLTNAACNPETLGLLKLSKARTGISICDFFFFFKIKILHLLADFIQKRCISFVWKCCFKRLN